MPEPIRSVTIRLIEDQLPPNDPSHGTPHAMARRVLEFELPQGSARWEQTDYGHPGRFNPWEPRQIDARLQPKTDQLRAAAEAIGALVSE